MKKIIIIVILALVLKPILPVVDYLVNYDYISTVLCENKAKPELKCNGKCHLMKELAKASDIEPLGEKPTNSDKKIRYSQKIELLFCNEVTEISFRQIYFHTKTSIGDNYANLYFHSVSCSVFHPPTTIS